MILKFIRSLVACSMNHYPGVSHRTFGFRTLSNDRRHEFDTRTRPLNQIEQTKKYSNWKKSNVQSKCFKKNLWDQVRMFYFRTSSIEFGHRTKWNSLQKNTSGTKSSSWSSVETSKVIWSFVSFLQWNLYVTALCLSGQFSKSRFFAHTNAVFDTCIRRPPPLRGRWQPYFIFLC